MSVIVNKVWTAFFNSNPASGSVNQSPDGSNFSVNMTTPLRIPNSAISCRAGVLSATLWNTSPNIAAEFKNNIFRYSLDNGSTYTIFVIPDGLYSLNDLTAYLGQQWTQLGLSPVLFKISGNQPTQQTLIGYPNSNAVLDFTGNSVGSIMGFPPAIYTYPAITAGVLYSPNVASFNRNNSYLISTNMVSSGIPVNSNARGIISSIPIPSGSINAIISYEPNQITWFDASELIGASKMNFSFQLSNENLSPTPTSGDYWSFTFIIEYGVLLTDQDVPLRP